MVSPKVMPQLHIPAEEYEAFRSGIRPANEPLQLDGLPDGYAQWLASSLHTKGIFERAGFQVVDVPVRWTAFSDYAAAAELDTTLAALEMYVMHLHYQQAVKVA